jgi:hypothetical protein
VGHGARRHVDDALAVPVDRQPAGVGDLADDDGLDLPLAAERQERVEVLGSHDRAHALLRLAHEDLLGRQRLVAQEHAVEPHVHAALAVRRELARGAGDPRAAEVLDPLDEAGVQHLEGGLDEQLLHERVAHLDARALGRDRPRSKVSEASTETPPMPSPPVRAP